MSTGQIPHYFRERSESSPDLTAASTPKRGRSPQDDLTNKRLRFAMEVQLTEEERKKAFSEAPLWARMLFDQISKVTEEISDVKGQLEVINDEFNSKLADVVARTDIIDVKVQGQEIEHEALKREVESLKRLNEKLSNDVRNAGKQMDELEQYSRRNCLIFTGIKEDSDPVREDTDEIILNICNHKLGIDITSACLDRTHRLGRKNSLESSEPKPRPIIAKFANYHDRSDVFRNKAKLKQSGIVIYENLTSRRLSLLNAAKEILGVRNAWSLDGKIFAVKDGRKMRISDFDDLNNLRD